MDNPDAGLWWDPITWRVSRVPKGAERPSNILFEGELQRVNPETRLRITKHTSETDREPGEVSAESSTASL